ncbi:MAG: hypothetical protein JNJ65_17540 [Cyclobacteriaceae bacterium]|nr:hypothetical protein [Cyclobacteriaceae bacterium]
MKNQTALWFSNPSLSVVLTFIAVWLLGNFLLVAAMTDFFREEVAFSKQLPVSFLMLLSTASTLKVIRNYFKARRSNRETQTG